MNVITSKAAMKKNAEKLPRYQCPDPIRELVRDVGYPYSYGYLAHDDSFVIVDGPSGLGTVIRQNSPGSLADAWQTLQGRLPDTLRLQPDEPSASGPVAPEASPDPHRADYNLRLMRHMVAQFRQHVLSGAYGH